MADWLVVAATFLVTELLMVHFVGEDLRGWLLGYGLVALVGVAAWAQRNLRIRQFADEERDLPLALATRHWYRAALAVAVTAFGLLGWLLYDPLGLDAVQVAVAAAGLVGVVAIIASSVPMWNRSSPMPAGPDERPCHLRRSMRGWEETGSPTRSSARVRPTWSWSAGAMAT